MSTRSRFWLPCQNPVFITNAIWKVREEKKADLWAAGHSTADELEAAAVFFEKHQHILDTYRENTFLNYLSSAITTGHPSGITRAHALRNYMHHKQSHTK